MGFGLQKDILIWIFARFPEQSWLALWIREFLLNDCRWELQSYSDINLKWGRLVDYNINPA